MFLPFVLPLRTTTLAILVKNHSPIPYDSEPWEKPNKVLTVHKLEH